MSKPKLLTPEEIARRAGPASGFREESLDPKATRSKRGLTVEESSQICFRIEKERHKAIKLHCVTHDLEIGEFLDEVLTKAGF